MKTFCFVGALAVLGDVKMTRFGQRFSIDEKLAIDAQKGGAAILSESDFNSCGPWTREELKVWADPLMDHYDVPLDKADAAAKAEFLRKRTKAQDLYCKIRQELLDPIDRHIVDSPYKSERPMVVHLPEVFEVPAEDLNDGQ